jgi:predicted nucleic acid-binding protein
MPDAPLYLLDTNILLAYVRGGPLGEYIEDTYQLRASSFKPLICVVSAGEMLSLAKRFGWGNKKVTSLKSLLDELVWLDINNSRILSAYADIDDFSRSRGRGIGKNDVWIAAAAKATGATLLTTDTEFDHLHETHIKRILIDEKSVKQ